MAFSAIVIGASSGIGLEIARACSRRGLRLGLAARRRALLEEHAKTFPNVAAVRALDASEPEAALRAFDELFQALAPVGRVYLCSGTGHNNPALDWSLEAETIRVNALGFAALAGAAMNRFLAQGHGHLIGITSVAAVRGAASAPAYAASKAFASNYLEGLHHRALRSGRPIFVTEVRPGFVDTAMMKADRPFWVASPETAAAQIIRAAEAGRKRVYVTPRWRLVAWLLSHLPDRMLAKAG
jgi:short-subunit dehydrogenase